MTRLLLALLVACVAVACATDNSQPAPTRAAVSTAAEAPEKAGEAPVSYDLQIFAAGVNPVTGSPITTSNIPAGSFVCNLPPVTAPPGLTATPRYVYWDDPALPGRDCRVDRGALFVALPVGTGFTATMTATHAGGTSARSAASNPFPVLISAPVVVTGVVVTP
jgi:hypothetical protein